MDQLSISAADALRLPDSPADDCPVSPRGGGGVFVSVGHRGRHLYTGHYWGDVRTSATDTATTIAKHGENKIILSKSLVQNRISIKSKNCHYSFKMVAVT